MNDVSSTVYVVDDDVSVRESVQALIRSANFRVETFASARELLERCRTEVPGCLVLDVNLPGLSGLELQQQLADADVQVPIVFITGHGDIPTSVRAMKSGALEFLTKPLDTDALLAAIRQAIALISKGTATRRRVPRTASDELIGDTPAFTALMDRVAMVAATDSTVLIAGETGTGKECVARAIHARSPRSARPLVSINCAAIQPSLIASELFGHERGAFTGALHQRLGRFELAEGGTLFLDEIGDLPAETQIALLRVLQEREVRPVGATAARRIDVRLISATNRDLRREVEAGRFRLDLFYRLSVFPIVMPPLRERSEDVAALALHFVERFARDEGKPVGGLHPETLAMMERYAWPGNVRQLENEVHRLVLCAEPREVIAPDMLAPWILGEVNASPATEAPLHELMRQIETVIVQSRLREHGYRRTETARSLGITRESLWAKLRALGLAPPGST